MLVTTWRVVAISATCGSATGSCGRSIVESDSFAPPEPPPAAFAVGSGTLGACREGDESDRNPAAEEAAEGRTRCGIQNGGGDREPGQPAKGSWGSMPGNVRDARGSHWELSSFDSRLACPPVLISSILYLLSEKLGDLHSLVRRSAFVVPGREQVVSMALDALKDGRHTLFLVAILPVLEHGLRCLFSCANGSPGHLFAQLRQYYSTLDGVSG